MIVYSKVTHQFEWIIKHIPNILLEIFLEVLIVYYNEHVLFIVI